MLVVEQAKALALKLNNPARVMECVPTARVLRPGIVVMPHRLDEAQVLKNLGFEVPSPILHYYDWPGRFKPYEHQRQTAAFLTLNKKALVLNEIGCVDADTEYLSPTGWKRIADYNGGAVAQYWPGTGKIDFVDNPEFVKLPCSEMIRIKTTYGIDQLLSPEHRVLYVSSTGKRMVRQASEIYAAHQKAKRGWKGRIITTFDTCGGTGIPLTDAQLRVQVALMADGYMPEARTSSRVQLRLKKSRKHSRIAQLLSDAGIKYSANACQPEGFVRFTFDAPIKAKSYGDWAWSASRHQLEVICDEVPHWDGSVRKAGAVEFFTRDKASADFVQYAYAATGRTASITTYERDSGTDYVVHARDGAALLYACGTTGDTKTKTMWVEPSTDGFKYCFMVPSTFLVLRRNGCIFATGNTGKTQSALWAADYLLKTKKVSKVLVLSPLSTLERVWGDAVFTTFPHRKGVVLHGTAEKRKKLLNTQADFYIINHDGFDIIADDCHGMFDLIIVDEAAVLRNPGTRRFKAFRKWMDKNPNTRLWLMTGTPTPNEPTDAWALAKLVNSPYCTATYTAFRDQVMTKIGMHKWLPRTNAVETVQHILHPSIRYSRDDCFDLPETIVQSRRVDLTPEQRKYYDRMMRHLIAEVQDEDSTITAVNEAVKMQKLVQIACGVAYDDNGRHVELDCSPRVNIVEEVIEEAGQKVIVFVPLTGTLHMLERELGKRWSVAVVNGSVSATERNTIFRNFQEAKDPHVLIAHPATMAHGLTLTAASTIIWYGPITSNEQYVQANGRVERIGKRHVSNVIHIEATDLEAKMYKRLEGKQKLQGLLLDLIQSNTR